MSVNLISYTPPFLTTAVLAAALNPEPVNENVGQTKLRNLQPGNIQISVYLSELEELGIDIRYGDYIGYYETESIVRYYTVVNDGRVTSDNKHTYGGVYPYYRTITAAPVKENEFRGN